MEALVLGGTQFIGLRLVRLLRGRGHRVTVLNRGRSGAALSPDITRLRADRNEPEQVAAVLRGPRYDAVFDISGYTPAQLEPVVVALEGRVGHYVFCSSVAVYELSDTAPVREDFPLVRSEKAGTYGRDKVDCEDLLLEACAQRGFPATICRPPVVYGPHNTLVEREFSFFARLTQGRPVIVPGDGLHQLHMVHADDLAAAFAAVPGRRRALGKAYTVCGDEAITAAEYVHTIGRVVGVTPEIVYVESGDYKALGGRIFPWHNSIVYSNKRARRDLDWSPGYGMSDGMAMTYRWWVEQGLDQKPWDFSREDRALEALGRGPAR